MIVPPVARERASTSPPCATASRRTMNRPMPMPPKPAPVAGLALEEPLEDPLVVAVGDADALVFHGDLDPAARGPGPDHDRHRPGVST